MPRPKKMRRELEEHGIMTNEFGIETGRLTLNGILVLNLAEVFFEIERWSATHAGKCSMNHLCKTFSRSGSWGYDPAVYAAAHELVNLGVISLFSETNKDYVRPTMTSHAALRRIPVYVTRTEAHAGLEELDE